ncbi:hypothetical protein Q9S36_47435 [Microbacterium sp. ARD31]|uniref:hypothetical protein n=1 Tax=Microbacterium sp. ARD31 TaxID=2962576 RepID=UPI002882592D|nr:hypothetical protein [Microbacterium sp. ARD31]MDT0187845.1 hypothetical protein [Microbacterium sp. ARD31]
MNFMQTKPGKVLLIWVLALLAAVVCFGLLESSGVIDNGVVQLGGAFAGFIATLYVLNRVWGEDDLEARATSIGSPFLYDEVVKALDLRNGPPDAPDQLVPLTDYYRVKKLGQKSELTMHYATTSEMSWHGSSTHPAAKWEERPQVSHTGIDGQVLRNEYLVTVNLGELARGEATPVINNVTYLNAFKGVDSEWLETHMEKPTGRLTMLILAPSDWEFVSATGHKRIERDDPELSDQQPAVISDGSVVYWSVHEPQQSVRYGLRWTWRRR